MDANNHEKADSNQMPQETLDRIRALAKEATPGPWICYGFTGNNGSALRTVSREDFEKICELPNLMNTPANAAYIAAMHPGMAMALVDEIERLGEEADWLAKQLTKFDEIPCPEHPCSRSGENGCLQCWREAARQAITK